jgi:hypothetical protein
MIRGDWAMKELMAATVQKSRGEKRMVRLMKLAPWQQYHSPEPSWKIRLNPVRNIYNKT